MLPQAPNKPGVYLIKDRAGKIIYVGKAISIAKRVKAHLKPDSKLAHHIADMDYIVTSTELEALILEAVLIKKHHPRYNVLLRDDKQYPYIKLTVNEEWPAVLLARRITDDGAKYFGPYRGQTVRDTFKLIKRLFRIRWCKTFKKRDQPCFYYHMHKCLAPCAKGISSQQYSSAVKDVELFLEGKFETAVRKLKEEMSQASQSKDYEAAAQIRDRIKLFEKIMEEQKVVTADKKDRDVFHVSTFGNSALALVLEIRSGKLTGKQSYFIKDIKLEGSNVLTSSMVQYYSNAAYIPEEIIADTGKNRALLEAALTKLKGSSVRIKVPRSGKEKGILKMAEENSKYMLQQNLKLEGNIYDSLFDLKRALKLEMMPYRIEAFDVSTTMGIETVGSMVAFEGGLPLKSDYRKFKVAPGRKANDDVAGIRNIVMRRYAGKLSSQLPIPDLVLIDGGVGQLNAAKPFVPKGIMVVALAKKLEEIFLPGKREPIRLKMSSPALKLLRRIRDEAHRAAVAFHRKRRAARMLSNA
ncbi:MAG: excinuclease ABC subunit UvrC [bacterium]